MEGLGRLSDEEIEKKFKLSTSLSCNNFVLFDENYQIKKYQDEIHILEEFYNIRFKTYEKRKDYLLKKYQRQYEYLNNKHRFIQSFHKGDLKALGKKK